MSPNALATHRCLTTFRWKLEDGEIVCLLGPSGCGKTTLLRIIAGLEAPDKGAILLQGVDLEGVPVHGRNFGLMFQDYALFPHMTVAQNVAFGLRMRRQDNIAQRTSETLSLVGMKDMGQRDVSSLSGGEQQRVASGAQSGPQTVAAVAGRTAGLAGCRFAGTPVA